jgi:ribonuclease inhibitor
MKKVTLDGSSINNQKELHEHLAKELLFPEWYSKNLDALHTCLTDPRFETELVLNHAVELQQTLGDYGKAFLRVLSLSAEENPRLHVTVPEV